VKLLSRTLLLLFAAVLIVLVCINALVTDSAEGLQYDDLDRVPRNKLGLLLGTVKYHPETHLELLYYKERVKAAAALYHAAKIDDIMVSSDNGNTKNAEALAKDLEALGVPLQRIIIDRYGDRTFHSVLRCKMFIRHDSVTIITQKRHGERALYLAGHHGLNAIAYVASGDERVFDAGALLHEQVARLRMIKDLVVPAPSFVLNHPLVY
jgi:SanA protein